MPKPDDIDEFKKGLAKAIKDEMKQHGQDEGGTDGDSDSN